MNDHNSRPSPAGEPGPIGETRISAELQPAAPLRLERLSDRAREYVEAASAPNTQRAYKSDWAAFTTWCDREGLAPLPPDPRVVGLFITACASGTAVPGKGPCAVSTIERRISALVWHYRQRGLILDRQDRHIATILAGIRNTHGRPPVQKEPIGAEDILAMIATLDRGTLRGMRDRAIVLLGYAGGLRRSEIVGLDVGPKQTDEGAGWIEILEDGMLVVVRTKVGWHEVEVGRGSSDASCPVAALEQWIKFARIEHGPIFRGVTGRKVTADRMSDRHVARVVKRLVRDAGIRGDLPEAQRLALFAGHSLRAGLASFAEADERYVQKQLGHTSAEMTRRYQRRRDRFRVNLTKAAGL